MAKTSTNFRKMRRYLSFMEALERAGLDPDTYLQECIDKTPKAVNLVRYLHEGCPDLGTGISYEIDEICEALNLSYPPTNVGDRPHANDGEVVFYYNEWSYDEVMFTHNPTAITRSPETLNVEHARAKCHAGYCNMQPVVWHSNHMTMYEQRAWIQQSIGRSWNFAPLIVVLIAIRAALAFDNADAYEGKTIRCLEDGLSVKLSGSVIAIQEIANDIAHPDVYAAGAYCG